MKKNGIAVRFRPHMKPYYGSKQGVELDMVPVPRYMSGIKSYVEASEYFELLEKYRHAKRKIQRMKRREKSRNARKSKQLDDFVDALRITGDELFLESVKKDEEIKRLLSVIEMTQEAQQRGEYA